VFWTCGFVRIIIKNALHSLLKRWWVLTGARRSVTISQNQPLDQVLARWIQSKHLRPISQGCILILFFHLHLHLPSVCLCDVRVRVVWLARCNCRVSVEVSQYILILLGVREHSGTMNHSFCLFFWEVPYDLSFQKFLCIFVLFLFSLFQTRFCFFSCQIVVLLYSVRVFASGECEELNKKVMMMVVYLMLLSWFHLKRLKKSWNTFQVCGRCRYS
jgi:hypothetical protein